MQQLARNIVAAHKRVRRPARWRSAALRSQVAHPACATQLDELVRALPASEPLHEQLARIAALRSDLAATGAELEAELERAGARPRGATPRLQSAHARLARDSRRPATAAPTVRSCFGPCS